MPARFNRVNLGRTALFAALAVAVPTPIVLADVDAKGTSFNGVKLEDPVVNQINVSGDTVTIYGKKLKQIEQQRLFFALDGSDQQIEVSPSSFTDTYIQFILPYGVPAAG